jgi:hypothetical protein
MSRMWVVAAALVGCKAGGEASWTQVETQGADILWVIDDSCSMAEEQEVLASGFVSFINELDDDDFHIGVITTSFDDGSAPLLGDPPYLTKDDDFLTEFADRARVGVDGSDFERGLSAAAAAVTVNSDFIRDEAGLVVIIVSDEEDCSDGGKLTVPGKCYREKGKLLDVADLVDDLTSVKDKPEMVSVGAIVGPEDGCEESYPGRRYWGAAYLTGGHVGDVCESDWSRVLGDLGLAASGQRTVFPVGERALANSIKVTVGSKEMEGGWAWDEVACSIVFDDPPEPGSKISATYKIDAKGDLCFGQAE